MIIPPMGKRHDEKCEHHGFYGRVLLTQQYTVQLGNEGISQDSSINESYNLNAEFSI